jgi:hypothetical protein
MPYTSYGSSMLATGEVMTNWTTSTQAQEKVRQATGSDDFSVELLNFANQEYPYYVDPYLIVSASAQDPVAAHQLFTTVTRLVNDHLAALQRQEGVAPNSRITTSLIGDSGPLIQLGSSKRSFAGLLVLTIVVAYLILKFLDRRSLRLHSLLRLRRRSPAARDPLTTSRRTSVA